MHSIVSSDKILTLAMYPQFITAFVTEKAVVGVH